MFDISFSELVIIAVVALLVVGPERLPKAARTLGHLFGRMQRYVSDVKADISREMELDELKKLQASMQDAASSLENSVSKELNETETDFRKMTEEASSPATGDSPPAEPPPRGSDQLELGLDGGPRAPERKTG